MDLKEIKQVIEMMKRYDLTEFEIEEEGLKLRLNRSQPERPTVLANPAFAMPGPLPAGQIGAEAPSAPAEAKPKEEEDDSLVIRSPMVGTFYRAPSPESKAFVDTDDDVKEETVVCIIEAMKVMNEIQAEVRGTIVKALVENGESVVFGQPLFKVEPL